MGALGGSSSYGSAINSAGTVVGLSTIQNASYHAFISTNGRKMQDLNSMIPTGTGWVLEEGAAINDAGQIAGYGTLHGQTHAFLLTPGAIVSELDFAPIIRSRDQSLGWPAGCAELIPLVTDVTEHVPPE